MNSQMLIVNAKSFGAYLLWWLFLGGFGAHKFYIGRPLVGIIYIVVATLSTLFPLLLLILVSMWLYDILTGNEQIREANAGLMADIEAAQASKVPSAKEAALGASSGGDVEPAGVDITENLETRTSPPLNTFICLAKEIDQYDDGFIIRGRRGIYRTLREAEASLMK